MIKRLSVISLALVLAACGSSTKLDENAAGAGMGAGSGAGAGQQGASNVQSVDLSLIHI